MRQWIKHESGHVRTFSRLNFVASTMGESLHPRDIRIANDAIFGSQKAPTNDSDFVIIES